jgi:hypothetical protein
MRLRRRQLLRLSLKLCRILLRPLLLPRQLRVFKVMPTHQHSRGWILPLRLSLKATLIKQQWRLLLVSPLPLRGTLIQRQWLLPPVLLLPIQDMPIQRQWSRSPVSVR